MRHRLPPLIHIAIAVAAGGATALASSACETDDATSGAQDATTAPDAPPADPGEDADATPDTSEGTIAIGEGACCLSSDGDRIAWADEGDIWLRDASTGDVVRIVAHPAAQKDPTISGDRLVWADARGGDFDLWTMHLDTREATPLVAEPGDQVQPSLDGDRLVFVSHARPPYDAATKEIYTLTVGAPASLRALTDDLSEQADPHVHGDLAVWSDFRNSETGRYVDLARPEANNSDIYGWDFAAEMEIVITRDPSKQLRPAVHEGDDGAFVVWLDWRGINPEPKYAEFQVFGAPRGVAARRIAWSSWSRPELWQRPAIHGGVVAWIAEPVDAASPGHTAVFAADLDEGTPWLVSRTDGVIDALAIGQDRAVWLGAGRLGLSPLRPGAGGR